MPRGGCSSCMRGGSASMDTLLRIITTIGVFLILMGFIIYNKDILDISIQAVSKDTMNSYIGYASIFLGTLLIFISAVSWTRA
jgi:hypothetical protein